MATYSKLPSGTWRVQRKGRYISETFLKRDDARLGGQLFIGEIKLILAHYAATRREPGC